MTFRKSCFFDEGIFDRAVKMEFPQELANAEATLKLGRQIGREVEAGAVIALVGDLGAGKTTLAQGIVAGLGYDNEVTSPTFTLVQEYLGGRMPVFHFDFYRVENEHELLDLGWDDYLERGGVVIVEWPSLYPGLLPSHTQWLTLSHHENGREITGSNMNGR